MQYLFSNHITARFTLFFLSLLKTKKKLVKMSSSLMDSIRAAAKQARDEEGLMEIMRKDFRVKSMNPNGDCAYELMCMWQTIHQLRRFGCQIPAKVIDEDVPSEQILTMRSTIADVQENQFLKGNDTLKTLIVQSLIDWSRSPLENNGRNAEVQAALESLPAGAQESDWFHSKDALYVHSSLVRRPYEVFAESAEIEAFGLMVQAPLAVYLPGHCEVYPQSANVGEDEEFLVGICNGNHYYLAVPKLWIENPQEHCEGVI